MLAPIFHEVCRILNWFCLLCHTLRHKNISYMQHFRVQTYSFQLILLTGACRKSQNLMARHLTRPYFLESCGSQMLLWCYSVTLVQVVLDGVWVVLDGFCWLRVTSDGFRWFAVLVVTSVSQNTEHLTLYCTHGRTWLTEIIRFFYSK